MDDKKKQYLISEEPWDIPEIPAYFIHESDRRVCHDNNKTVLSRNSARRLFLVIKKTMSSRNGARMFFLENDNFPMGGDSVEIGVRSFEHAIQMYECLKPNNLFLVDFEMDENKISYQKRYSKVNFNNVCFLNQRSDEAALSFDDNSLDFIYIDAGHSFKNVSIDLYSWVRKVKTGGIVAGHDFSYINPNIDCIELYSKFLNDDKLYTGCIFENILPFLNEMKCSLEYMPMDSPKYWKKNGYIKKVTDKNSCYTNNGVAFAVVDFLHRMKIKGKEVQLKLFADGFQPRRLSKGVFGYEYYFVKNW